jgi:hypothetical protein
MTNVVSDRDRLCGCAQVIPSIECWQPFAMWAPVVYTARRPNRIHKQKTTSCNVQKIQRNTTEHCSGSSCTGCVVALEVQCCSCRREDAAVVQQQHAMRALTLDTGHVHPLWAGHLPLQRLHHHFCATAQAPSLLQSRRPCLCVLVSQKAAP